METLRTILQESCLIYDQNYNDQMNKDQDIIDEMDEIDEMNKDMIDEINKKMIYDMLDQMTIVGKKKNGKENVVNVKKNVNEVNVKKNVNEGNDKKNNDNVIRAMSYKEFVEEQNERNRYFPSQF